MLVCVCYVDLLLYLFAFMFFDLFFFFFKQKTAYEIRLSLVGSEMCIRDRSWAGTNERPSGSPSGPTWAGHRAPSTPMREGWRSTCWSVSCLLYTSDAAD